MSEENVEIVRAAFAAFNRRDWDAILDAAAPDFELDWSRALGPYRGVYQLEQLRAFLADFDDLWDTMQVSADEYLDVGGQIVTPFTNHAKGRRGIETVARGVWVWTIRDGALLRNCLYQELDEALAAAGLHE
jgi:uncharacterized protein